MSSIKVGQIVRNLIPSESVTINKIQRLGSMVSIAYTGINSNRVNTKVISLTAFEQLEVLTTQSSFDFKH